MALYWICLIAFLGGVAYGDDNCPNRFALAPCTCDEEGLSCMGKITLDEIKKAFQLKYDVRSVWIQGTPITNLPANVFGNIKTHQYIIEINSIRTVDLRAFSASNKTLRTLSLYGNKIKEFDFGGLGMFENLQTLNLGRNEIEILPDDAFNSRSLQNLILANNKIRHIGSDAFFNLPSLRKIDMAFNQVYAIGPRSLSTKTNYPRLQIDISANRIAIIDEDGFSGTSAIAVFLSQNDLISLDEESFVALVVRIGHRGGFLEVSGNPFSCKGCENSWLVANKDVLASKVIGFKCTDGRNITDLTFSNIGCNI